MKKIYVRISLLFTVCLLASSQSFSQNTVDASATDNWTGFINVFDFAGAYMFGSGWGVADFKTTADSASNTITLQPNFNTYADNVGGAAGDVAYWTNSPDGGVTPGPTGNKIMDASTFAEPGSTFNGVDLTFRGSVSAFTLDTSLYTAKFFIKALDPAAGYNDALAGAGVSDLPMSGNFSITIPGTDLATGLIVQYGFNVFGVNANPVDEATIGSVVVTAFSAPTQLENKESSKVSFYPNPANDQIRINANQMVDVLKIRDLTGKVVAVHTNVMPNERLDVSFLSSSLYLIEFQTGMKKVVKKLSIK